MIPPAPDVSSARLVVGPRAAGYGNWAGAPSAVYTGGWVYLAYRLRERGETRGSSIVVARSADGFNFETLAELSKDEFGAASLERAALVTCPDQSWRLYVSCATPGSYHWWIDVLAAPEPDAFDARSRRTVLPGDETTAVKDPVVTVDDDRWRLWVCCHPLEDPAATDRMYSRYAESQDGEHWDLLGDALVGPAGLWDARGTRIASVTRNGDEWLAFYDGRASASDNAEERTGLASGPLPYGLLAAPDGPAYSSPWGSGSLRYVSVVNGRIYFEASLNDGSHGLFTQPA